MKIAELKTHLAKHPTLKVRFHLPTDEQIPAHAHVTEVARIDKTFVDCGGTFRKESLCRLQTWTSDDADHRLTAGTLLKILNKGASFLETEELEVDVEHEAERITQFPLKAVEPAGSELILRLGERHTDCLAKEKCCPAPSILERSSPLKFQFSN